ncbi:MAG: DNA mismatch repair protein MutS [Anaerolineae bacterium]|nr:DNA mismatch repair protein MutS [Anaerolineae bacterium]
MARVTPLRQQYLDIKKQYPNCILFFRLGDFYETFDEDAEIAARELDLVLTGRPVSKEERVPMAGVPHHALESYIARLIEKGYHVAVCEQLSEPDGRGIVERDVTRVITPGTIIEPELLVENQANYLMGILPIGDTTSGQWSRAGIAYVDISTGEFAATQLEGENVGLLVLEELARLVPREVIMPAGWVEQGVSFPEGIHLTSVQDWRFEKGYAESALNQHFHTRTLDGYGLSEMPAAIGAAGAVLQYVRDTQRNALAQLTNIRAYSTANFMVLDPFTRRNLELTETIRSRKVEGSLLGMLDRTVTAMGARLLRTWISQPLLEINRLNARLDAVETLAQDETLRTELSSALKNIADLERLTNRLLVGKAGPRDLLGLKASLDIIPHLQRLIEPAPPLAALIKTMHPCEDVSDHINRALSDNPPAVLNSIGTIREGYAGELDDILNATRGARDWIANLEPQERRRTGIASVKVGFNKVFGYYIEVSNANVDKVPADYIRKQTLVNAERYITPELKEYETLVLNAEEAILKVEKQLFEALCHEIMQAAPRLLQTARAIAHLDVFLSMADVAVREGYTRPILTEDDLLLIKDGRHPVVEQMLDNGVRYVPNDTHFDSMSRIHIITGPNMSGKSTYIRQVAIITLMAQVGSFVPADEATIGLVDRIFARIGAQDEIHAGQSTFMVEMVETARLLSGSTRRSLLILDEVGRGTSTYDGLAIARSVVEYIHNNPRLNCRTLFATHYHELTELPNILPRTRNYNVAVSEDGENIIFLHKVISGGADRSYGVHVAQLAGMPRPVVERARELLEHLESQGSDFKLPLVTSQAALTQKQKHQQAAGQMSLFTQSDHPAVDALRKLVVDHLSPLEALTKLYELKKIAEETQEH